jgi:type IV secretory pathway VirB4 component
MLLAMAAALTDRQLTKTEANLMITIAAILPVKANFTNVINLLANPPEQIVAQMYDSYESVKQTALPLLHAYNTLLKGPLAGIVGDESSTQIDFVNSNGVIIDLHAIYSDPSKLVPIMLGCAAWLSTAISQHTPRKQFLVIDEAWGLFSHVAFGRWIQSTMKLARAYGVSVMFVIHRARDLQTAGAVGSESYQVASSLLADTQTRILFGHDSADITDATTLFNLTEEEAELLPQLQRGTALWKVGDKSAIVHHIVAEMEHRLIDTDTEMR